MSAGGDQLKNIIENSKGRKLVVWGCGRDGRAAAKLLRTGAVRDIRFCDSDPEKQRSLFLDRFEVLDPAQVLNSEEYYVVVAASSAEDEISGTLTAAGKKKPGDYCVFSAMPIHGISEQYSEDILLSYLKYLKNEREIETYIFLVPDVSRVKNPSANETAMKYMSFYIFNEEEHLVWLQSVPTHIACMYGPLGYTKEFIKGLFTWPRYSEADGKQMGGSVLGFDHNSGTRVTTDIPQKYEHRVHFCGPSTMAGFGVEDRYTIPSCFQRIVNTDAPGKYRAVNHSHLFRTQRDMLQTIYGLKMKNGDTIVMEAFRHFPRFITKCAANAIPVYDLACIFDRPHDMGEVFFDGTHINHIANQAIAKKMYEICVSNKLDGVRQNIYSGLAETRPEVAEYLKYLRENSRRIKNSGAIVMNCNPFTLGHKYLIEYAAKRSGFLYIFVVQEDRSAFPFEDRIRLVREGVSHLDNVSVLQSGALIISTMTFPEYFDKEEAQEQTVDATLDLELFGEIIAPVLDITTRYVGEEPFDAVTGQYNEQMKLTLPDYGIDVVEIPRRKTETGEIISASGVRKALKAGDEGKLNLLVPQFVSEYLKDKSLP